MKIVAFLQNQWFKDPERVRALIARHTRDSEYGSTYRQKFLTRALFSGCLTGRRLQASFGDLCDKIFWEEASPEIGCESSSNFPPDEAHIRQMIETERPELILCFSRAAFPVIDRIVQGEIWCIQSRHPAARQPDTIRILNKTAAIVRDIVKNGVPPRRGIKADAFAAAHRLTTLRGTEGDEALRRALES